MTTLLDDLLVAVVAAPIFLRCISSSNGLEEQIHCERKRWVHAVQSLIGCRSGRPVGFYREFLLSELVRFVAYSSLA